MTKTYHTKHPEIVGDKALESSEVASNESGSKSHRTPMERSQNCCCEKAPFKSERPGLQKKSGPNFQLRGVGNLSMVLGSSWFQLFTPKGKQPNIDLKVPVILSVSILD